MYNSIKPSSANEASAKSRALSPEIAEPKKTSGPAVHNGQVYTLIELRIAGRACGKYTQPRGLAAVAAPRKVPGGGPRVARNSQGPYLLQFLDDRREKKKKRETEPDLIIGAAKSAAASISCALPSMAYRAQAELTPSRDNVGFPAIVSTDFSLFYTRASSPCQVQLELLFFSPRAPVLSFVLGNRLAWPVHSPHRHRARRRD